MADEEKKTSQIRENLKDTFDEAAGFSRAILEMLDGTQKLNEVFGQTRQRATEMMKAVSDTALRIVRLGGSINDVYETMSEISEATGKNVIANADAAGKMYATSQVLGKSVHSLVSGFADVGVQFAQIDDQMEVATKYVRDMGLNTKQVMDGVLSNFDKLNKYNFEGGVQGMTKMAAKATMFRIDMRQAFELAEKVISPEGAVEVASAFQRLGVAAGNMADPFALMNASINDPGALQDTIVNIGKQFTYFDEKTKSFKINPQGMLTMRELAKETGISYDELTKAGLAASELDKRLSQISPSVTFKDESDKQFLSNLAQMNDKGEYEVKISDTETKKLSEITQEEFNNLIDEQKKAPKDMEDVARAQLSSQRLLGADVKTIMETVTRGTAGTALVRENLEGFRKISESFLGSIAKDAVKTDVIGKNIDKVAETLRGTIKGIIKKGGGSANIDDVIKQLKDAKLGDSAIEVGKTIAAMAEKAASGVIKLGKDEKASEVEQMTSFGIEQLQEVLGLFKTEGKFKSTPTTASTTQQGTQSAILGSTSPTGKIENVKNTNETLTTKVSQSVDFGGTINIKVDAPSGVSAQYLQELINSEDFKRNIYIYIQKQMQSTGKLQKTIPGP